MIVAGEASGDLHASGLIRYIRQADSDAEIIFVGGDLMAQAADARPLIHISEMNVMGFWNVLNSLPRILRQLRTVKRSLVSHRPDALVLVDYPGFNLKLAKYAHSLGVPVHYFISPKLWAWKEYRIKTIRQCVQAIYSILPFEVPFYKKHGYDRVTYVGNPTVEEMDHVIKHMPPMKHFLERQGIDDDRKIIALLPGSRQGEIRCNLPLMIEAVRKFPQFQYIVAAAPSVPMKFYRELAQDPGLKVIFGCTPTLVKYSVAALVTSGTATLETALMGTPQVVCYRSNGMKIAYKLMEKVLKVKYVSLPNLIAANDVVPELLVHQCTAENIARHLSPLLQPSPQRDWQLAGYKMIQRKLGTSDAPAYAAELICVSLGLDVNSDLLETLEKTRKPRRKKRNKKTDDNEQQVQP